MSLGGRLPGLCGPPLTPSISATSAADVSQIGREDRDLRGVALLHSGPAGSSRCVAMPRFRESSFVDEEGTTAVADIATGAPNVDPFGATASEVDASRGHTLFCV